MTTSSAFERRCSSAGLRSPIAQSQVLGRTRGFTLLEVLVALIVLSIGLLGLSGLQTTGLHSNHSALLRSEATMLANDILDRMRANRTAALDGEYNITFGTTASPSSCVTGCKPSDIADADIYTWRTYIERQPGRQGQVNVANGVAEIQVQWVDDRSGATSNPFVTVTAI